MPIPYQTVYGVLMNHPSELAALGDAVHAAPYKAPPKAPVLYIKPSNTHYPQDKALRTLAIPYRDPDFPAERLALRPCLGLVFKRAYAQNSQAYNAIDFEVGLFLDFAYPHESFYRPPIKFNAIDHSLVTPSKTVNLSSIGGFEGLSALEVMCTVKMEIGVEYKVADFLRQPKELLASVNEFIGFEVGDVLLLGCPAPMVQLADPGALLTVSCGIPSAVPTMLACVYDPPTREYVAMMKAQREAARKLAHKAKQGASA